MADAERVEHLIAEVLAAGESHPVLRSVMALRRSEVALTADVVADVAARLGARPERITSVAGWLDEVLAGENATPIRACRSVSCDAHGAANLHAWLRDALTELGCDREIEVVYCLEQCDRGPSIACGRSVYTGGDEDVSVDDRHWHEARPGLDQTP